MAKRQEKTTLVDVFMGMCSKVRVDRKRREFEINSLLRASGSRLNPMALRADERRRLGLPIKEHVVRRPR